MFEHGRPHGAPTITTPDTKPRLLAGQRKALWKLRRKGITLLVNAGLMCIFTSAVLGCHQGQESAKLEQKWLVLWVFWKW